MLEIEELAFIPWPATMRLVVCNNQGQLVETKQTFIANWLPFSEKELLDIKAEAEKEFPPTVVIEGEDKKILTFADNLERNYYIFSRLLHSWDKVTVNGAPLPYSTDVLRKLVTGRRGMAASDALNKSLSDMRFGEIEASEKNSPTSSMPGTASDEAEATTQASLPAPQP